MLTSKTLLRSEATAFLLLLAVSLLFGGCRQVLDWLPDEDHITQVAGRYYTGAMDNGIALHWYEDDSSYGSEPLLESVYNTQICGQYLVARAGVDFYFLYPIEVQSLREAEEKRIGPVEQKELMSLLLRLTGDTILHQAGSFKK